LIFRPTAFHIRRRCQLICARARSAVTVSVHAVPFSVWFSALPPGRHTDGGASPRRIHLICVPLSRRCFATSASSPPNSPQIGVLSRCGCLRRR
jgi:hypothetical protein